MTQIGSTAKKMSQTATISQTGAGLKSVTLHNGQTFTFKSNISTDLEKIPVIDASRIWSERLDDRQAVAEEIREASRTIGFFYLVNHVRSSTDLQLRTCKSFQLTIGLGNRREVRCRMFRTGKAVLCAARGKENGSLDRAASKRVRRLSPHGSLQQEWMETPRLGAINSPLRPS